MRRLDKLIISEVLGPWLFGAALFTVLILAGQFLFQFTNYVVKGISPFTVAWLFILNLPGVFVLTFPMATLLAMLLGFGRLSGESELVAVRAAGVSLYRIMRPVFAFGLVVSILTFLGGEFVVPAASREADELQRKIVQDLEGRSDRPTSFPIYEGDKLVALVAAKSFDLTEKTLEGVTLIAYGKDGSPSYNLWAEKMVYKDETEWKITGAADVTPRDGGMKITILNGLWPRDIPQPPKIKNSPDDIRAQNLKKLDAQSMRQLGQSLASARANPGSVSPQQMRNLEYGYWNKIAIPLAALVYSLVGAPFGIRQHRTGAAAGFWMAILIIFGYFLLGNVMGIAANGGAVTPFVASFSPLAIGMVVAIIAIQWRNR